MRRPKFSLLSLLLFTLLIASTTTFILNAPAWKTIPLNAEEIFQTTFSPSGRYLAIEYELPLPESRRTGKQKVQERERRLALYDAQRGYKLLETSEYHAPYRLAFSTDEKLLLVSKDTTLLWDWSNNKVVHTFNANSAVEKHNSYYYVYHASHRNRWLIPESDLNHKIELQYFIYDISFSKDQSRVLTLSDSGNAIVYELPSGETLTRILEKRQDDSRGKLSPDGKIAAIASQKTIRLYTLDASQPMRELKGHAQSIHTIRFLSNGNLVSSSEDQTTREWNTKTGEEIARLPYEHYEKVTLAYENYSGLVAISQPKRINQYPAKTQSPTATLERNDKAEHFLKIQTRPNRWWTIIYLPEFWTTLVLASLFLWNLFRKPK